MAYVQLKLFRDQPCKEQSLIHMCLGLCSGNICAKVCSSETCAPFAWQRLWHPDALCMSLLAIAQLPLRWFCVWPTCSGQGLPNQANQHHPSITINNWAESFHWSIKEKMCRGLLLYLLRATSLCSGRSRNRSSGILSNKKMHPKTYFNWKNWSWMAKHLKANALYIVISGGVCSVHIWFA